MLDVGVFPSMEPIDIQSKRSVKQLIFRQTVETRKQ